MNKHPNILMFMTDNQSAYLLGCYGNQEIHTPHLDRLAARGLRFDNAFCVNGGRSPCRASVMTGLMPSQHGLHTWINDRQSHKWPDQWNAIAEFVTLPEILVSHGYKTALIGKYHLGSPFKAQNSIGGIDHSSEILIPNDLETLSRKLDDFFSYYAAKEYDVWNGGSVKSTTDKAWLWKDAWGKDWTPGKYIPIHK